MKTIAKTIFLCGIIVFTAFSCEKEEDNIEETLETLLDENNIIIDGNFSEIILGKWELIWVYYGNKLVNGEIIDVYRKPLSKVFFEFGLDSLLKRDVYDNGELKTELDKYWIDSLLHCKINSSTPWDYSFYDNDILKLSSAFPAYFPRRDIYKRIK